MGKMYTLEEFIYDMEDAHSKNEYIALFIKLCILYEYCILGYKDVKMYANRIIDKIIEDVKNEILR